MSDDMITFQDDTLSDEMQSINEQEDSVSDKDDDEEEEDGEEYGTENLLDKGYHDSSVGVIGHFSKAMLLKERNAGIYNEVDLKVTNFLKSIVRPVEYDESTGCVILVRFGT